MVSSKEDNFVYDIKVSTVAPACISGCNAVQEITDLDLAMKLHYLRFVYYFGAQVFDGMSILQIKETMFDWLNHAYIPCGRIRRTESGRPFIKCNDGGVRIIEAKCRLSLDEWLESKHDSRHKFLAPNQVLGPDLFFSPFVLIQLTKFTCGATSVGLSWAHLLGDAFSAISFIRLWAQAITGHFPAQPLIMAQPLTMAQPETKVQPLTIRQPQTMAQPETNPANFQSPISSPAPSSVKRVGPIGDLWSTSNNSIMETFSFYVSESELAQLQSKICQEKDNVQIPFFECICVVVWQSAAKVRQSSELEIVTICRSDLRNRSKGIMTNKSQTIDLVRSENSVAKCSLMDLGLLIMNQAEDQRTKIEEAMTKDNDLPDFLVYGANLTFVDMSDSSLYEMEMRGQKPVYVNCVIDNIGDEGVVLVLPAPKGRSDGRIVSVTFPENQIGAFKSVLKEDWCIA